MRSASLGYRYLEVGADDLRRELYLTSVGCLEYRPGDGYPAGGHPAAYDFTWSRGRVLGDFAVVYIEKGHGAFESRAGKQECSAGDVFLLSPGEWHRYRPDPRTGWRERWVCANGEYLHRLKAKRQLAGRGAVCATSDTQQLLVALQRSFRMVVTQVVPNDLAAAALALEVFGLVTRAVAAKSSPARAEGSGDALVDAAREFLWVNSHRPLTVEDIATQLGVSRLTLERRYAQGSGQTIVGALIAQRVRAARQLLVETRMSVKAIAYATGFGDSRRLIRNFARKHGQTPAAFRRREMAVVASSR